MQTSNDVVKFIYFYQKIHKFQLYNVEPFDFLNFIKFLIELKHSNIDKYNNYLCLLQFWLGNKNFELFERLFIQNYNENKKEFFKFTKENPFDDFENLSNFYKVFRLEKNFIYFSNILYYAKELNQKNEEIKKIKIQLLKYLNKNEIEIVKNFILYNYDFISKCDKKILMNVLYKIVYTFNYMNQERQKEV